MLLIKAAVFLVSCTFPPCPSVRYYTGHLSIKINKPTMPASCRLVYRFAESSNIHIFFDLQLLLVCCTSGSQLTTVKILRGEQSQLKIYKHTEVLFLKQPRNKKQRIGNGVYLKFMTIKPVCSTGDVISPFLNLSLQIFFNLGF